MDRISHTASAEVSSLTCLWFPRIKTPLLLLEPSHFHFLGLVDRNQKGKMVSLTATNRPSSSGPTGGGIAVAAHREEIGVAYTPPPATPPTKHRGSESREDSAFATGAVTHYPHYCPICMMHFTRVLEAECCHHNICELCALDLCTAAVDHAPLSAALFKKAGVIKNNASPDADHRARLLSIVLPSQSTNEQSVVAPDSLTGNLTTFDLRHAVQSSNLNGGTHGTSGGLRGLVLVHCPFCARKLSCRWRLATNQRRNYADTPQATASARHSVSSDTHNQSGKIFTTVATNFDASPNPMNPRSQGHLDDDDQLLPGAVREDTNVQLVTPREGSYGLSATPALNRRSESGIVRVGTSHGSASTHQPSQSVGRGSSIAMGMMPFGLEGVEGAGESPSRTANANNAYPLRQPYNGRDGSQGPTNDGSAGCYTLLRERRLRQGSVPVPPPPEATAASQGNDQQSVPRYSAESPERGRPATAAALVSASSEKTKLNSRVVVAQSAQQLPPALPDPEAPVPSPVRVGASFDDLRKKLRPFEGTTFLKRPEGSNETAPSTATAPNANHVDWSWPMRVDTHAQPQPQPAPAATSDSRAGGRLQRSDSGHRSRTRAAGNAPPNPLERPSRRNVNPSSRRSSGNNTPVAAPLETPRPKEKSPSRFRCVIS
jgi:hypothetical protein